MLASALAGYPYRAKVWFNHMSNPVYGIAGFRQALADKLKDPRALPLAVSINPYINETSALADYIVPDTVTYESWGMSAPWADVIAKASTVRWPAVQPRVARTATDEPVCLETFLIACAKRLGMPGFGAGAITDKDGAKYALDTPRTSSCAAWPTSPRRRQAVPEASDDDMALTGVDRYAALLQAKLAGRVAPGGDADEPGRALRPHAGRLDRGRADAPGLGQAAAGLERGAGGLSPCHDRRALQRLPDVVSGAPGRRPRRARRISAPGLALPAQLLQVQPDELDLDRRGPAAPGAPAQPVSINRQDGERLGLRNGDKVRIVTPGGSVIGLALLRDGIQPGAVGIEHGYGHTELARARTWSTARPCRTIRRWLPG